MTILYLSPSSWCYTGLGNLLTPPHIQIGLGLYPSYCTITSPVPCCLPVLFYLLCSLCTFRLYPSPRLIRSFFILPVYLFHIATHFSFFFTRFVHPLSRILAHPIRCFTLSLPTVNIPQLDLKNFTWTRNVRKCDENDLDNGPIQRIHIRYIMR